METLLANCIFFLFPTEDWVVDRHHGLLLPRHGNSFVTVWLSLEPLVIGSLDWLRHHRWSSLVFLSPRHTPHFYCPLPQLGPASTWIPLGRKAMLPLECSRFMAQPWGWLWWIPHVICNPATSWSRAAGHRQLASLWSRESVFFRTRFQPLSLCALVRNWNVLQVWRQTSAWTASELLKFFFSSLSFFALGLNLCGADHNFQEHKLKVLLPVEQSRCFLLQKNWFLFSLRRCFH